MKEEYDSIIRNDTWELTQFPQNKVPIGCKQLFKLKFKADESVDKYKARFVAKGYSQKERTYYDETFTPLSKINIIKLMISLATKHKWKLHQLDAKYSFLNGELKEVYVTHP